jgi:hypothetical protein
MSEKEFPLSIRQKAAEHMNKRLRAKGKTPHWTADDVPYTVEGPALCLAIQGDGGL